MASFLSRHRRALAWGGAALLILCALTAIAASMLRQCLLPYVAGAVFRDKISEETSHGLKVEGQYTLLHPDGWGVTTATFRSKGRPGESIAGLDADGIAGRFNPWGVLRRRWQLDWVSLDHATVTLRKSDPSAKVPLPVKPKPWYAFALPNRIYLKEVRCPDTEVLWTFRDKPAGIHHIDLRVTPYGKKDWRFASDDGSGLLSFPPLPPFRVADISVTLSKPWFTLEHAALAPEDPADPGRFRLSGKAGLQEDKTLALKAEIERLPLGPWLPEAWRERLDGRIDGAASWDGNGTKLEGSRGEGTLRLSGAALGHLPLLDRLALFSKNPAFRELRFSRAALAWRWKEPAADISGIEVEAPGLVRLSGNAHVEHGALSGALRLGLRPEDLQWLPQRGATLFPEEEGGYRWTRIALSGTAQKPVEDFTPRLRRALLRSPGTLLKLGWEELFGPKS